MSAVFGNWGMSIKRRRIAANVKQYVDATNLLYKAADVEAPLQVPTPMEGEAMMRQAMLRVVRALEPYGSAVRAADVQSEFTSMQTKRTAMQSMLRALLPKVIEQSEGLKKEQLVKMNGWLGRLGDAFVTYSTMAQLATLLESSQVEAPVQAQPPAVPRDDDEDGADEPMEQEPAEGDPMEDTGEERTEDVTPAADFTAAEERTEEIRPPTYRDWLSRQAPKTEGVKKWIALIDSDDFYDLSMRNEDEIMQMVELYEPFKADDKLAIITQPYRTFWEFHKEDLKNLDEVINAAATYSKDDAVSAALEKLAAAAKDYIKEGVAPKEGGPSTPLPPEGGPSTATGDEGGPSTQKRPSTPSASDMGGPSTEQSPVTSPTGKRVKFYTTPSKEVNVNLPVSPQDKTWRTNNFVIIDKENNAVLLSEAKTPLHPTPQEMLDAGAAYIRYKKNNYQIITDQDIETFTKKFEIKFGVAV